MILCFTLLGFASSPLLNCGVIIACRKEFVQFPALCWQLPADLCFHISAESVPLEQGQWQADVAAIFTSPAYLSSRWATHWNSPKVPPKIKEWLCNKSGPLLTCSSLTASRELHSTTLQCLFAKGSSQCSCSFWCRKNNCLGKLNVPCTGKTTLAKWSSLEWQIKSKHTRTTNSSRKTLPFTSLV